MAPSASKAFTFSTSRRPPENRMLETEARHCGFLYLEMKSTKFCKRAPQVREVCTIPALLQAVFRT
jgi:hypothetical protein